MTKQNSDIWQMILEIFSTFIFPDLTRILLQYEQFIYLFITYLFTCMVKLTEIVKV
jgi:hypothetical protein